MAWRREPRRPSSAIRPQGLPPRRRGSRGNPAAGPSQPGPQGQGASSASAQVSSAPPSATRGNNWAVDKKHASDIAIQRRLQVLVRGDRLVLLPGRDRPTSRGVDANVGATVLLDGATQNGLDDFVDEVRSQVRNWGIAGQGLYWRPVLMLNVAPDGANRAQDLVRLLHRSGIDVQFARTATLPSTEPASGSKPMRDNQHQSGELPGQDSFLDIVANMVGILILLVMVVGLRAATSAGEDIEPEPEQPAAVAVVEEPEPVDNQAASQSEEPVVTRDQLKQAVQLAVTSHADLKSQMVQGRQLAC